MVTDRWVLAVALADVAHRYRIEAAAVGVVHESRTVGIPSRIQKW